MLHRFITGHDLPSDAYLFIIPQSRARFHRKEEILFASHTFVCYNEAINGVLTIT